jgi:tetratricopeptide (TPR) repeat protein
MEAERANLTATADHALHHGPVPYAIAITRAMNGFLRAQGHWQQAIRLQSDALTAAERINDHQAQADALCSLGDLKTVTGQYEQAIHALHRALASAIQPVPCEVVA